MNNFPAINQKNLKPIKDDAMSNLRKNVQRQLANQRAYDKNYKNLGKINPQPAEPAPPTEIKGIDSNRNVKDIYISDFDALIGPYIGDVNFMNLIKSELTEDQMKEIVLNWDTIKPQIDKLKGTRIEKEKFTDLLQDLIAESMFKKGKLSRLQQEQELNRRNGRTFGNNNGGPGGGDDGNDGGDGGDDGGDTTQPQPQPPSNDLTRIQSLEAQLSITEKNNYDLHMDAFVKQINQLRKAQVQEKAKQYNIFLKDKGKIKTMPVLKEEIAVKEALRILEMIINERNVREQQKRDQEMAEQRRPQPKQEQQKQIPHKMTEKELALEKYLNIIDWTDVETMATYNHIDTNLDTDQIKRKLIDIYMTNPSKLILLTPQTDEERELLRIINVQEQPSTPEPQKNKNRRH
jgi:hypothetical protein